MKVSAKKRTARKPTRYKKGRFVYKPKGRYSSLAELHASPEWKAYVADYTRKHDMLMHQNHSFMTPKQQKREAKMYG